MLYYIKYIKYFRAIKLERKTFVLNGLDNNNVDQVPDINNLVEVPLFKDVYELKNKEEVSDDQGEYFVKANWISKTSYSEVYKGRTRDNREIAVKIGNENNKTADESAERTFLNEALTIKQLKLAHPELLIPDVIDFTVVDLDGKKSPVLVTEWIDGVKLYDLSMAYKFKNVTQVSSCFDKIANTLDLMHKYGITHGDLTGGNIIVNKKGDPMIIDLGLSNWTSHVNLRGYTPGYITDEVFQQGFWKPRDELYPFAVMLYEAVTGGLPIVHEKDGWSSSIREYTPMKDQIKDLHIISGFEGHIKELDRIFEEVFTDNGHKYNSCEEFMNDIKKALGKKVD